MPTRRRLLQLSGAGLSLLLAGCSSQAEDPSVTTTATRTATETTTEQPTTTEEPEKTTTEEPEETTTQEPEAPSSLRYDVKDPHNKVSGLGLSNFSTETSFDDLSIPDLDFEHMYWDDINGQLANPGAVVSRTRKKLDSNYTFAELVQATKESVDNDLLNLPYALRATGREIAGRTPDSKDELRTWELPAYAGTDRQSITMIEDGDTLKALRPAAGGTAEDVRESMSPTTSSKLFDEANESTAYSEFAAPMYEKVKKRAGWQKMQWQIQRSFVNPVSHWGGNDEIVQSSGLEKTAVSKDLAERNKQNYLNMNTEEIVNTGKAWIGSIADMDSYDVDYAAFDWKQGEGLAVYGTNDEQAYQQVAKLEASPEGVGMAAVSK